MERSAQYKVKLASIPEGRFELDFVCDKSLFDDLGTNDIIDCNVGCHAEGLHRGDVYTVDFKLEGEVSIPCDRCLDPLYLPIEAEYHVDLRYGEEHDESGDDVIVLHPNETTVDFAPMIRDTILLDLPVRRVHEPGECNPEVEKYISQETDDDDE